MFKADNEVHCILAHFISRDLRLEIKSAKRTVATSYCVKFRIEIINAMRQLIDEFQIGIARTLFSTFSRLREITGETRQSCLRALGSNPQNDCSLRLFAGFPESGSRENSIVTSLHQARLLICFITRELVSSFGLKARTCFPVNRKSLR